MLDGPRERRHLSWVAGFAGWVTCGFARRGQKREARGRQLWLELHTTYDFTDCPEKLIILEQAARTADVVHRLQSIVDAADDLRVKGPRASRWLHRRLGSCVSTVLC